MRGAAAPSRAPPADPRFSTQCPPAAPRECHVSATDTAAPPPRRMNGASSDASTSTDDVKGRPLCLFYFTQPVGVLSPEPPTLCAAPPHLARAFLNMEPVSPFYWAPPSAAHQNSHSHPPATGDSYELGAATVHARPLRVAPVVGPGPVPLPRADSLASSLVSSDLWWEPCAPRRLVPYTRMLPPLRLPSARAHCPPDYTSDEVWPRKCRHPEKFSLPPIELPAVVSVGRSGSRTSCRPLAPPGPGPGPGEGRACRRRGVNKQRRRRRAAARAADLRRVLACLMRRSITEGACEEVCDSPALVRALATLRAAWPDPADSHTRHRQGVQHTLAEAAPNAGAGAASSPRAGMPPRLPGEARPHASPGLLCRRYSVPETIMRKYRLAQQHSDSEESVAMVQASAASACGSATVARSPSPSPSDSAHRFVRRDRELMRKSALLRRMWARPCRCLCEEARATRSLEGSRAELCRSPGPPRAALRTSPKRQRLDSTLRSQGGEPSFCSHAADMFTDTESRVPPSPLTSERVTAELDSEERSPPSYGDSEPVSASLSTAKETDCSTDVPPRHSLYSDDRIQGVVSDRSAGEHDVHLYERPLTGGGGVDTSSYELLEIVVSESADGADLRLASGPSATPPSTLASRNTHDINIDEYVSNILVESLNSLSDQLECMNASIGGDRRISIVEKEIKVRLQNTGVNTIVHLSPTSNNQIIFGNEELCNESRDECNNPLSIREERHPSLESNNNLSSSAGSGRGSELPPPRDPLNRAVLHQIQQLFRDELCGLEEPDQPPAISLVEVSSVDAFMEAHGSPTQLEITTRTEGDLIAGVGAGNYFRDGEDALAVPRFSAYPHTESMEVNTSSSSEAEAACSECASLVDSLDDPNSPRGVSGRRRRPDLAVLDLLPESARDHSADSRGEVFFVRIEDDRLNCDRDEGTATVAEYMPEKIKQRLYRRHRKRELRMECLRRSKVKQLKKELERRRVEEAAQARRELEQDCMAIVLTLIDDVVARIAREEYKYMRVERRNTELAAARSGQSFQRRARRAEVEALRDTDKRIDTKRSGSRRSSNDKILISEKHHIRGKLLARPFLANPDRPPRRIYQKSEIHEGNKSIEILEILEYVNGSQSSPETTNSDDNQNTRCRKSRIPIPVHERIQRRGSNEGSEGRLVSPTSVALVGPGSEAPDSPPPANAGEPRSRSNSLRFRRVFDMIPEERSSLSVESSAEETEVAQAVSPQRSPGAGTRSAATSPPPAALPEERALPLRSQTTMTSPCTKSAATSPLRPPRPPPPRPAPPRPAREGRGSVVGCEAGGAVRASARGRSPSSSSGESVGSGSLAPRWLATPARARRRARAARLPPARLTPHTHPTHHSEPAAGPASSGGASAGAGGWSVTVAGSCRAALPADVEMRLRFPHEHAHPHHPRAHTAAPAPTPAPSNIYQACACVQCGSCAALPPAHKVPDPTLTLTMKKEAQDSSVVASKSVRKSSAALPELETYRASRTKLKSSLKTRRGYSLHCWLPADEPATIRANNGLSVMGCAIIPELKPRVPTMSERDLTRVYTPRHYLRS